jgi:RNA-splicing ligase RtcB
MYNIDKITVFGFPDGKTLAQMHRTMQNPAAIEGVLCADSHLGYGAPIGGVVAYGDAISPRSGKFIVTLEITDTLFEDKEEAFDIAAIRDAMKYAKIAKGLRIKILAIEEVFHGNV